MYYIYIPFAIATLGIYTIFSLWLFMSHSKEVKYILPDDDVYQKQYLLDFLLSILRIKYTFAIMYNLSIY